MIQKEFITVSLDELVPYENNPRKNDEAVSDVIASIEQCSDLDPIEIDENNVILSGHTRLKAMQKLGYATADVIRYTGLSEEIKRKYRLLSNKTGEKAEWDLFKLEAELSEIDFDGYDFEFDMPFGDNDVEVERIDDESGYYGDARESTYKSTNFDRFDSARADGFYQMPIIKACNYIPDDLIGFNYAKSAEDTNCGVHFFVDDYQFERMWNRPDENIERLKRFQCVFTPDWSLYLDMPMALKVWNVYRSRLIGQMCQDAGLKVIPTLSWAEPSTYSFCFDGIEKGGTVAVSTVGVMRDKSALNIFYGGLTEAIKRINPKQIILYGSNIDYDFGNIKAVHFEARKFSGKD